MPDPAPDPRDALARSIERALRVRDANRAAPRPESAERRIEDAATVPGQPKR